VSRPVRFLLAAVGGLLEALAFPLVVPGLSLRELDPAGHLELLAWVGLVPALVALRAAASAREAFLLGLASGLAAFYALIYWVSHAMTEFGGVPRGVAFVGLSLLVLYMAAHWGLAFLGSHVVRRALGWPLWAHLPVFWVATELLRNHLFSGFPWGNLGYSQARHLVVAQLASLLGVYGVAGLVVLVNAVLADGWGARGGRAPRPLVGAGVAAAAVAATLAYGASHLTSVRREMEAAPRLRVGLVQANVTQSVKNEGPRHAELILARLWPLTEQADRQGAVLVAWPEAAWPTAVSRDVRSFDRLAPGVAPLGRAHLLVGATTFHWQAGPGGLRQVSVQNGAFLLEPDLSVVGRYAKRHLVPFGEYVPLREWLPFLRAVVPDLAPAVAGERLEILAFEAGGRRVALAPMICFDAIFPEIARDYALQSADLLLNPTNDAWYGYSSGPYQFLAIVRMRAIETRRAVARPAYSGVSAVLLPTGEVAPGALEVGPVDPARAPDPEEPSRLLLADVPVLRERTLYTKFGDLFAWACAAAAAVQLAVAWARRPPRSGPGNAGRTMTPWPPPPPTG
jgi:apolipoprotein N-acyltransferase